MLVAGLGAGVAYAVESGDSTADATEQTQVASGQETSESQDTSEDSVAEGAEDEADGTADTADAQNAGQDDAIGDDAKTDDGSTDKVDTGVKVADTEDAADGSDAGISTLAVDGPDHTVRGVSPRGTTINVFDYWIHERDDEDDRNWGTWEYYWDDSNAGINKDHALKFSKGAEKQHEVASFNKWTGATDNSTAKPYWDIVNSRLGEDGYPVLNRQTTSSSESLSYLFDTQDGDYKKAFSDVDGLLQVDGQGYYYYSSGESTGESNGNFAQFNEDTKDFTLYNTWGVGKGGQSPNGQFFPFNTGEEVFQETGRGGITQNGITSTSSVINHYFGLSMSTRFVQPDDGVIEGTETPMTYNFSGDDDVWVYIDDVLVGDLGGIHNKTSLEINFQDGHVYVYKDSNNNNRWDQNEERYKRTTLGQIMGDAGVTTGLNNETFANGTYHTLDFFYLERGNTDSNMSLKYNLVVPPETDIVKVDQDGQGVNGAKFAVYVADKDYKIQGDAVCTATTGANGSVVLLDAQGMPITFDQLWTQYSNSHSAPNDDSTGGGERINLVLSETKVPTGYRSTGDIHMYLWHKNSEDVQGQDDVNLLLADMSTGDQSGGVTGTTWQTGAYAQPTVQVTAPDRLTWEGGSVYTDKMQENNGRLFAIVEKKNVDGTWVPVYYSQQKGWIVAEKNDIAAVRDADDATQASFMLASSGSFQALIDGLPGRIQDYVFFHPTDDGGEYRGAYFYTTAGTGEMNADNTHRVTNAEAFGRQFAAHLYVPNIINRVIVQKTDDEGKSVDNATMGLYPYDQVEFVNGKAQLKEDAKPVQTQITRTLSLNTDKIDLDGAAVFTRLKTGTYWIVETAAPAGYAINPTPAKVIVTDDGVYADAGEAGDGIEVTRGVGRIVRSMLQFATDDHIDATLHHIVATPQIRDAENNSWTDVKDAKKLHLHYGGDGKVLDYGVETPTTPDNRRFTVDTGIPYLKIQQCNNKTVANKHNIHVTEPRIFNLDDTDISGLFTGVTIVQVTDQRLGKLNVTKQVTGNVPTDSQNLKFEFTVTFTHPATEGGEPAPMTQEEATKFGMTIAVGNGAAQSVTMNENGAVSFSLHNSETAQFVNVPTGVKYAVAESKTQGFDVSYDDKHTGAIPFNDTISTTVTNSYVEHATLDGDKLVKVRKTVAGTQTDDDFTFELQLSQQSSDASDDARVYEGQGVGTPFDGMTVVMSDHFTDGQPQSETFDAITFTEPGTYMFEVKERQPDPVPTGWDYDGGVRTVTVTVGKDWSVSVNYNNTTADTEADQQAGDCAAFTNRFGKVSGLPLTGGDSTARTLLLAGGGVLLVAGVAWLLARRRRV